MSEPEIIEETETAVLITYRRRFLLDGEPITKEKAEELASAEIGAQVRF